MIMLLCVAQCQAAISIVDISTPFGGTKIQDSSFGQTFTPNITGNLDGLRLYIASSAPSFTVTVWEIDSNTGNLANILGSQSKTSSTKFSSYGWAEVVFAGKIQQIAGQPMAFTISGNSGFWGPAISSKSTYSGGAFFEYAGTDSVVLTGRDLTFETLATPIPEPEIPLIAAAATILLMLVRTRRF